MSIVLRFYFFFFILLCMIHENFGREIAKRSDQNIQTTYDDNHHGYHHKETHDFHHVSPSSSSSTSHMDHMDISWNIFFHIDDLKIGKKMHLYLPIKNSSISPHMIPKQEAQLIPFSSTQYQKILHLFSFAQDSPQAKAILHTLEHCELAPLQGETKFCATSLESMLDNLGQIFGLGNNFKVLTTTHLNNMIPKLQNYIILEDPKEIYVNKMVGCHPVPYPYAVYYCHGQVSDNKLFMVALEGEDGVRIEAVAICHMDTSQWDRNHVSFRVLRIEPGTSPVCHVFPQDNLVWVSSPSSANLLI